MIINDGNDIFLVLNEVERRFSFIYGNTLQNIEYIFNKIKSKEYSQINKEHNKEFELNMNDIDIIMIKFMKYIGDKRRRCTSTRVENNFRKSPCMKDINKMMDDAKKFNSNNGIGNIFTKKINPKDIIWSIDDK